ncbi:MAG: hypothetical protein WD801_01135 [Gemmatimonadaceae bacterium]
MAQFLQPDFSKGDPNTLRGYTAVHDRPAAFEGSDGYSYSVEIMAQRDGVDDRAWGAWLFFVKWARMGASAPEGHLESDELARAESERDALEAVGNMTLADVKRVLDDLIARAPGGAPRRKWWDAMADDDVGTAGA